MRKRLPKQMTTEQYLCRFEAEIAALKHAYCDIFGFWRRCACKRCRRARACVGDHSACLKGGLAEVPRRAQWQARQMLIKGTPKHAGPPEKMAREYMPAVIFEMEEKRDQLRLSIPK